MNVHLLREEGRAIQNELKQISDIENQAVGACNSLRGHCFI